MLGIVEKIRNVFSSDFEREITRREKSTQPDVETRREAESEEQTQTSESVACEWIDIK